MKKRLIIFVTAMLLVQGCSSEKDKELEMMSEISPEIKALGYDLVGLTNRDTDKQYRKADIVLKDSCGT